MKHALPTLAVLLLAPLAALHSADTLVYKQAGGRELKLFVEKPTDCKASDKLIPVSVLREFEAGMKKAGARCESHIYPKAGHGFFNKDPHFTLTLIEADKFLASLGWLKGPPTLTPPTK